PKQVHSEVIRRAVQLQLFENFVNESVIVHKRNEGWQHGHLLQVGVSSRSSNLRFRYQQERRGAIDTGQQQAHHERTDRTCAAAEKNPTPVAKQRLASLQKRVVPLMDGHSQDSLVYPC